MKQHPAARELLAEVERYLAATGTKPTRLGLSAARDGNFVARLRDGRTPQHKTIDKVRAYIKRKRNGAK